MKIHHPLALVSGLLLVGFSMFPTRKPEESQSENVPNASDDPAKIVPTSTQLESPAP